MGNAYDAIVVGGGHNGLVSSAYLARAGLRTVVLEARSNTGGAATTEQPRPEHPLLSVTRLSYVMSLMPPTILEDLQLERHGYRVHPMGPYYQALPEGGSLTIHEDDPVRTREQIGRWSSKDARAWEEWNEWLAGLADVLAPLLMTVPPTIGAHHPADLAAQAKLAWRNRGVDARMVADITRLMTMSIADLLDDWFESHTAELETYAERLIELYDDVAPGFRDSIIALDIVGPHQKETDHGLIGGNIFHGELSLEQLFHLRPAPGYADYRTPVTGLYNAGSATHAGGGVCGIPGMQAARAALRDARARRRSPLRLLAGRGR